MKQSGYIAISSLLIISAVLLTIGISVSLSSINEIQSAHSSNLSDRTLNLLEACIEEALLVLNETNAVPASVSIPDGSCSIAIDSQTGTNWTFTTTASANSHSKSITVSAVRSSTITLTSWKEN